jgi:hypothetical protein
MASVLVEGVMPPNSALVTDACTAALRAFVSTAQRGRYTSLSG